MLAFPPKSRNGDSDYARTRGFEIKKSWHMSICHAAHLQVEVFEEKSVVGGACRTEYPFPKVPGLGHSTGAYLLGVMPPELMQVS
jgi:hypothetical protein